jgi:hypothetical protein
MAYNHQFSESFGTGSSGVDLSSKGQEEDFDSGVSDFYGGID